jgi:hypothetical protein
MWVSAAALAARRESLTRSKATRKLYWVLGAVLFLVSPYIALDKDVEGNSIFIFGTLL